MGSGISTHFRLWEDDLDQQLSFWMIGNVQHLFRDQQLRTFDFKKQGPFSRYMLLKEFDEDGAYTGTMINAINFATRTVDTKMSFMGDVSVKLAYDNCGFTADIGYNFWGRSEEEVRLCLNAASDRSVDQRENTFGFKGCEDVAYNNFVTQASGANIARGDAADPATGFLASTQNDATAFSCGTTDNPQFISGTPIGDTDTHQLIAGEQANLTCAGTPDMSTDLVTNSPNVIPTDVANNVIFAANSEPPVLLSVKDLNIIGVPSSLTHKVFGYAGYTWYDNEFTPFFGVYGEVEFDHRKKCKNSDGKDYHNRSINQWGIAMKMGITY